MKYSEVKRILKVLHSHGWEKHRYVKAYRKDYRYNSKCYYIVLDWREIKDFKCDLNIILNWANEKAAAKLGVEYE